MATHVVKGKDGERVYLNDAEYKQYKARQKRKGCLSTITFLIFILILCYLKVKSSEWQETKEEPPIQFTEEATT